MFISFIKLHFRRINRGNDQALISGNRQTDTFHNTHI